jgi:2-polyprenyl-3-methyl-5-hydroxy-6-metoxy-1,4-benzoquinol methylase
VFRLYAGTDHDRLLSTMVVTRELSFHDRLLATIQGRFDQLHGVVVQRIEAIERHIATDAETAAELTALRDRSIARLEEFLADDQLMASVEARLADVSRQVGELVAKQTEGIARAQSALETRLDGLSLRTADDAARTLVNAQLDQLGDGCAQLLNYATGHRGFAAQAGVWLNYPVFLEHRGGAVAIGGVNERIVEVPYVMAALGAMPTPGHILDFGATESTLALSLASLGHDVVAVDHRPYPVQHPKLTVVTRAIETWEGPQRPFDAIVSISSLEHAGLPHYGGSEADVELDRMILERFRAWLKSEGFLVLTAPYGRWSIDGFQRTYDTAHLDALLERWRILDRRFAIRTSQALWSVVEDEPPPITWDTASQGIVLLRAMPSE